MPTIDPALMVLGSFYAVALLFFVWGMRQTGKARQAALLPQLTNAQVVREAVGDLPEVQGEPLPPQLPVFRQFLYVVILSVLFTLVYLALYDSTGISVRLVQPNLTAPDELLADFVVALVIPLLIGWLVLPLTVRWIYLSPSERKLTERERRIIGVLGYTKWIAIVSTSLAMPIIVDIAYGWFAAFLVLCVDLFVFAVLWRLVSKSVLYFPQYRVQAALANADYDEALRRLQHFETRYAEGVTTVYSRGTVLLFAGQHAQAEKFLRQSLPEAQKFNRLLPEALTNLGYALLRQGRYDEATRAFQGAIKLNARSGHAYGGLAEVYLYQGIEPQQALDSVAAFLKSTPIRQVKDRTTWGTILGDEAWALALLGRQADAQQALRQAFEMTDKSFRPGLASLHFREGKVYQKIGDAARATTAFQRAVQLDPVGAYGQLAKRGLIDLQNGGE